MGWMAWCRGSFSLFWESEEGTNPCEGPVPSLGGTGPAFFRGPAVARLSEPGVVGVGEMWCGETERHGSENRATREPCHQGTGSPENRVTRAPKACVFQEKGALKSKAPAHRPGDRWSTRWGPSVLVACARLNLTDQTAGTAGKSMSVSFTWLK